MPHPRVSYSAYVLPTVQVGTRVYLLDKIPSEKDSRVRLMCIRNSRCAGSVLRASGDFCVGITQATARSHELRGSICGVPRFSGVSTDLNAE